MLKQRVRSLWFAPGLGLALALILVMVVYAASVTVDSFDDGAQNLSLFSPGTNTGSATGSMLGGERDASFTLIGGIGVFTIDNANDNKLTLGNVGTSSTSTAFLQWDGSDNSVTLAPTGLGGVDLTDSGSNDSFRIRILSNDFPMKLTFKVYTDGSNWSQISMNTPGGLTDPDVVDLILPFADFTTGGGSGATFSNVGAVVFEIDSTLNADADLSLDFMETTAVRDYGDLPSTYGSAILSANHVPDGLRLGTSVDAEAQPSSPGTGATADDTLDVDDEDGVTRDTADNWTNGANVDLNIVVKSCGDGNTCYVNGWIDWNGDGDFSDTYDQVLTDTSVTDGTNVKTITVPGSSDYTVGDAVYARFRICSTTGTCNTVTGSVNGGEVEDYYWDFEPTAVSLTTFTVTSGNEFGLLLAAAILVIGLLLASRWVSRRTAVPR